MLKDRSLPFISFLQASGTTVYCLGIAFILENISRIIDFSENSIAGPLLFLLLFVLSALITGTLVLGYPVYLIFAEKNVKKALLNVVGTILWSVLFITILIIGGILI